jgi:hypothetical protein
VKIKKISNQAYDHRTGQMYEYIFEDLTHDHYDPQHIIGMGSEPSRWFKASLIVSVGKNL